MSKKPRFSGRLVSEHGKSVETMFQSGIHHLYNIYQSLWRWLLWKKSLLVIHKILRLFLYTLRVNDKHSLLNRDNLTEPIKIQLSQKQKIFSELFFAFLKSILNFKRLPKNMTNWWKQCSYRNDSTFTKAINDCEGSCIGKSLF